MTRSLAVLLTVTLMAGGCATAGTTRRGAGQPAGPGQDRALLTGYLKQLPIGSRVRASLASGETVRGTLMNVGEEKIVVLRRTRIPEPPTAISIDAVSAVEIDNPDNLGRSVGIGLAAGAGGALGMFLLLVALLSD